MNIATTDVSVSRHTSNLFVIFFRLSHLPGNCVSICYQAYMCSGTVVKGALLERSVSAGMSPSRLLADDINSIVGKSEIYKGFNGIVDTMQIILSHHNFVKPRSGECSLLHLLSNSIFSIL